MACPAGRYGHPLDVVNDTRLTRRQKIALLAQWRAGVDLVASDVAVADSGYMADDAVADTVLEDLDAALHVLRDEERSGLGGRRGSRWSLWRS